MRVAPRFPNAVAAEDDFRVRRDRHFPVSRDRRSLGSGWRPEPPFVDVRGARLERDAEKAEELDPPCRRRRKPQHARRVDARPCAV